MTVYVITSGSYSGYRIECIFSTRALAQAYIDKAEAIRNQGEYVSLSNDAGIEEYELDQEQGATNHSQWWASLRLVDGVFVGDSSPVRLTVYGVPRVRIDRVGSSTTAYSPESLEHAKKLCVEDRQAWQREQMAKKGWAPA